MTAPVRTPVIEADGALLWFDLRELLAGAEARMRIEVLDAAAAEPWLTRLAGGDQARVAIAEGTVEIGAPAALARLAFLLWARRWWPASPALGVPALDPALLALEAAEATAAVDELSDGMLDGFEATPAELFDLAAGARPVAADARAMCERLARWFDEQDDLDRAEAAERLAVGAAPAPSHAVAAGLRAVAPGEGVLASGLASVDWALVPPGVLDAAEDTVSWWVLVSATGTRVHVDVAGALGAAELAAMVVVDGQEVAVVDLDERFRGVMELDEAAAQLVAAADRIDVHVAARGVGLEIGTTREDRAEVMSLVLSRTGERTLAERVAGVDEF